MTFVIQQLCYLMSTKQMKTKQQIFKSKVINLIIKLETKGNYTAASTLYQTYFLNK